MIKFIMKQNYIMIEMTIGLDNQMSKFKGCQRKYVLSRSKMYLQLRISQEFSVLQLVNQSFQ